MSQGLQRSVQDRLVRHAHDIDVDPNMVLVRYAMERFLYRLSRSEYAELFILKGALLMLVWLGETIRPTRDADLLGLGDIDTERLRKIFTELCTVRVEPDGLTFDASSVRVAAVRAEDEYGGQRVKLVAYLGRARFAIQIDVGIGDAVSPAPEWVEYPTLLDMPHPRLRAYRPETAIAEKVHAMVLLGSKNSRMRDFFDVHALSMHRAFHGATLAAAISSTFERRRTSIPSDTPIALTPAFAEIDGKQAQWSGYLRRNRLESAPAELVDVVLAVGNFVAPVLAAADPADFDATWPPGGPWETAP